MAEAGEPRAGSRDMVDYALAYARRGWPVFPTHEAVLRNLESDPCCTCGRPDGSPANVERLGAKGVCKSPGKHPRTEHGLTDATTDERQIRKWWRAWPNAPIAIRTGDVSGVWVWDLDTKPPKLEPTDPPDMPRCTGIEALAWVRENFPELPATVEAESGSGGVHFFFTMPPSLVLTNKYGIRLPNGTRAGMDVRANGGYVLVAPSSHASGRPYRWTSARGVVPAPAPDWLLALVDPAKASPAQTPMQAPLPPARGMPANEEEDYQRRYAESALANACQRIVNAKAQGQSRHNAMRNESWMIGGYVPHLLDEVYATQSLIAAASTYPDKTAGEIHRTITSGIEKGKTRPRWPPPSRNAGRAREPSGGGGGGGGGGGAWGPNPPDDDYYPGEGSAAQTEESVRPAAREEEEDQAPDPELVESERRAAAAGAALLLLRSVVGKVKAAQGKADMQREFGALLDAGVVDGLATAQLSDELACEGALNDLVVAGMSRSDVERLRLTIRRRAAAIAEADLETKADRDDARFRTTDDLSRSLGRLARSLASPIRLQVPVGYEVNEQGTWKVDRRDDGDKRSQIIQRPIFIGSISADADSGAESVVVRWWDGRAWRDRFVSRAVVGVARKLAEESQYGLPVSSQSASDLVSYFEAFLAENESRLPRKRTSTTQGWVPDAGFLLGGELIAWNGPVVNPSITVGLDDLGTREIVSGYRTSGTWEGWVAAIQRIEDHPRLMLALLASMAPPLIRILRSAPNFILDFAGTTSHGKTTALRVGASVWGYPDDKDGGIIRPWASTPVFIERTCAVCSDLPVFLDDTKAVKNPGLISKTLYMIAQGQGKGRGSTTGVQLTGTWRTVALSTGESPATEFSADGGASARCLTLWGSPIVGGQSDANRDLAEAMEADLLEHHGHAGRRMVAWLQGAGRGDWVRQTYATSRAKWGALAQGNAVIGRASAYLALLEVAEEVSRALGVPTCTTNLFVDCWDAVVNSALTADKAALALRAVYEWSVANVGRFYGRHNITIKQELRDFGTSEAAKEAENYTPAQGWLGSWKRSERWEQVAILPDACEQHLRDLKFDPGAMIRSWADRGWLDYKKGDGFGKPARVGLLTTRCYCIRRSALEEIGELDQAKEREPAAQQQQLPPVPDYRD